MWNVYLGLLVHFVRVTGILNDNKESSRISWFIMDFKPETWQKQKGLSRTLLRTRSHIMQCRWLNYTVIGQMCDDLVTPFRKFPFHNHKHVSRVAPVCHCTLHSISFHFVHNTNTYAQYKYNIVIQIIIITAGNIKFMQDFIYYCYY